VNESKTPSPETPEVLTPQVSFLRGLMARVSEFLSDEKQINTLTGPSRLTAEIVARTGKPVSGADALQEIIAWRTAWDGFQKIITDHNDDTAKAAFNAQHEKLHELAGRPEHQAGSILTREQFEEKFALIRESARTQQWALYTKHIFTARAIAAHAAQILDDHAVHLEADEKSRYARYGLTYTGSPLVAAVKQARAFVLSRVSQDQSPASPELILPWLIL
jgi:hypothetical protein